MAENFSIEKPQDTGDDRVTFIIKYNGSMRPGFISRSALLELGGDGTLIQLFNRHHTKIAAAVRSKFPAPMLEYVSLSSVDFK